MQHREQVELFEEMGRGTLGTTHRARLFEGGEEVAAKVLHPKVRADWDAHPEIWRHIARTARSMADSERFALIREVDPDSGTIVSALMPQNLVKKGRMPAKLATAVLVQGLQGLEELHAGAGVLHGAVHRRNFHVDARGFVRLSDPRCLPIDPPASDDVRRILLGLDDGDPGTRRHVAMYQAPELWTDRFGPLGVGLDLYALGMLIHDLARGGRFDDSIPGVGPRAVNLEDAWRRRHVNGAALPTLESIDPEYSPKASRLVERLTARDVEARPTSAAEALEELGPALTRVTVRMRTAAPKPGGEGGRVGRPNSSFDADDSFDEPDFRHIRTVGGVRAPRRPAPPPRTFRETLESSLSEFVATVRERRLPKVILGTLLLAFLFGLIGLVRSRGSMLEVTFETTFTRGQPSLSLSRTIPGIAGVPDSIVDVVRDKPFGERGRIAIDLPPGIYHARASAHGYDANPVDPVLVDSGSATSYHFEFRRRRRRVEFPRISPAEARASVKVWHQGRWSVLGATEVPVDEPVILTISAEGFLDKAVEVDVPGDGTEPYHYPGEVTLSPDRGPPVRLIVQVLPAEAQAKLTLDGLPLDGPVFERPSGTYQLEVRAPGFEAYREPLMISRASGPESAVKVELTPTARTRDVTFLLGPNIRASVRRHGSQFEPLRDGETRAYPVGTRLIVRVSGSGLAWTERDLVVVQGAGPLVEKIVDQGARPVEFPSLGLKLVPLNPDGHSGDFYTGIDWDVLEVAYPRPRPTSSTSAAQRGSMSSPSPFVSGGYPVSMPTYASSNFNAGSSPMAALTAGTWSPFAVQNFPPGVTFSDMVVSQFFCGEALCRRFVRSMHEGRKEFEASISQSPTPAIPIPSSFLSSTPITWFTWGMVMGSSALPAKVREQLDLHGQEPVHGVTAAESEEFCKRLTGKLLDLGLLEYGWGWTVALPSYGEMVYAEKAGLSDGQFQAGGPSPRGRGPDREVLARKATDGILIVAHNIGRIQDRLARGGKSYPVSGLVPNSLGVALGAVSTWTSDPSSPNGRWVAGPSYRDAPTLGTYKPWPASLLTPADYRLTGPGPYFMFHDRGYWPGRARSVAGTERHGDVGLFVVLKLPPTTPSNVFIHPGERVTPASSLMNGLENYPPDNAPASDRAVRGR